MPIRQMSERRGNVLSRARAAAVKGLARELDVEVDEALVTQAGMPRADVAKQMLSALFA